MIDRWPYRTALGAVVGVIVSSSGAARSSAPAPASVCPALFGYPAHRQENRERRREVLYWVHQDEEATIVAHGSDRWEIPQGVDFADLSVERTSARRGARWVEVQVGAALAARVGCPAGVHRLTVDDSIGEAQILAVLPGGVLVELGRELRYLVSRPQQRPRWLMAWGSRYKVYLRRGGSGAGKVAAAKPPARRPAPPKPPPPRKR